jgi:hypothetical protein
VARTNGSAERRAPMIAEINDRMKVTEKTSPDRASAIDQVRASRHPNTNAKHQRAYSSKTKSLARRIEGLVAGVEAEALTIASYASAGHSVITVGCQSDPVAVKCGVILTQPFVQNTHQASHFR